MRSKQRPTSNLFLVQPDEASSKDTLTRLASIGTVEHLEGVEGVLLRVPPSSEDPRTAWQRIRKQLGGSGVSPVLIDEADEMHFPTGEVTVRFATPPSDGALEQFAKSHGLELRQRNRYVAAQASFLAPPKEYLPDVLASLEPSPEVVAVWANTKSRFRRG